MSAEKESMCGYGHSRSTGRQTHVEPTKPKTDEERREDELNLLRSFESSSLKTQVIPNHKQIIRYINETGKITPSGALLSDESRSIWLKESQQTIDLSEQVLQERGEL